MKIQTFFKHSRLRTALSKPPFMSISKIFRSDAFALLFIWMLILLIVNPVGNFPLNDDWAYAQIVKRFIETGVYDLGFWPGMSLFTHVMWGSLFCKLFGFSFTVLRCATLVLAIIGSLVFLSLMKDLNRDSWNQRISVLVLIFNPFFFLLAFSYMTDVPFVVMILIAVFFFKKAFERDRYRDWALALLFSVLAILTRQLALILPIAFGAGMVLRFRDPKHLILAAVLLLGCFGSLYGYTSYMEATVGLPPPFGRPESLFERLDPGFILGQIKHRGGIHLFYWNVFLLPLLALLNYSLKRTRRDLLLLAGATLVCAYFFFFSWNLIPIGNIFYVKGFGPMTFADIQKGYARAEHISRFGWGLIEASAAVGSVFFLYYVSKKIASAVRNWRSFSGIHFWKLSIGLLLLGYSAFMLIDHHKFDRYFFPVYPLLIILLTSRQGNPSISIFRKALSVGTLLVMAVFSVIATNDYLSWQEARWTALTELVEEQHISPHRIDGGFEFNGWYETGPQNPGSNRDAKSWWFVDGDEYDIGQHPYSCYEEVKKFPTNTILDPIGDTLRVLKKPTLSRVDTLFCDLETLVDSTGKALASDGLHQFTPGGKLDSTVAFSGKRSVLLLPENPYALGIDLESTQPCEQITITVWRKGNPGSAGIVIRAPKVEELHSTQHWFTDQHRADGWSQLRHELTVPSYYQPDTLLVYMWNPVPDSVWMDDLQIIRRRYPE